MGAASLDEREWTDVGGDLEASFDGFKYVDIRVKGKRRQRMFMSRDVLKQALKLFPATAPD